MSVDGDSYVSDFTDNREDFPLDDDSIEDSTSSSSMDSLEDDQKLYETSVTRDQSIPLTSPSIKRKSSKKGSQKTPTIVRGPAQPGEKDMRISTKNITDYEYCMLIGSRAQDIADGEPVHPLYANNGIHDLIKIAKMELDDRSIEFPLNVLRPIGNPMDPVRIEVFNPHEPGVLLPGELLVSQVEAYISKNSWKVH